MPETPASLDRRNVLRAGAAASFALVWAGAHAQETKPTKLAADPLPSWNDGAVKTRLLDFVKATTDPASPDFVAPEARIATFDQDGTTWVEQPLYTQLVYCLDRVPALAREKPELKDVEPFRTILSGAPDPLAKLTMKDVMTVVAATLTGMDIDAFQAQVARWLAHARHPRWDRPYTELVYQPMLEAMAHLRANGYRTYTVTGGGQEFVRVYAERVYGLPPEQVVGTMLGMEFAHDAQGRPTLRRDPKLLLNDNEGGKAVGINMVIGRRPVIAFGNTSGDREMLDYATGGPGPGLGLLVLHDDATREYAYGPARGLPDSKVGAFSVALYDEAIARGWPVISMKTDWRRVFPFDP